MNLFFKPMRALKSLAPSLVLARLNLPVRGFILTWILGQCGPSTLAAGALSLGLFFLVITFFTGTVMSSVGILSARAMGRKDHQAVTEVIQQGMWAGLLLCIPSMLLFYGAPYAFQWLGQQPAIMKEATPLLHWLAWTFIPYVFIFNAYKLMVHLKKPRFPLIYTCYGMMAACITSYVLALGKLGLPALGSSGVGIGMVVAF
jgi:multidrug resistance protein, MATE family